MSEHDTSTITLDLTVREYDVVISALEKHLRGLNHDGWTAQTITRTLEHLKAQVTPEKPESPHGEFDNGQHWRGDQP